jgi:hypothetical protein
MASKSILKEFDPVIFPVKVWVSITDDFDKLSETFSDATSGRDIDTSYIDGHEAVTYYVHRKNKPKDFGVLIATTSKSYFTTKLIAHEATHGADFIWDHTGESDRGDEANAYLVGWIADCIEKTTKQK